MRRRPRRHTMPVRSTRQHMDYGVESGLSEKDSDYVTKTPKVWSRELRSRFVISSRKGSLRYNNADGDSKRITVLSSNTLSNSEDEDRIFSPVHLRSRRLRLRHSLRHSKGENSSRSRRENNSSQPNETVSRSPSDDDDEDERMFTPLPTRTRRLQHSTPSSNQNTEEGIRRSTRVKKLKYDNYRDSWIIGAQTLRGYPSYTTSYRKSSKTMEEEEEEMEEEDRGTTQSDNGEDKIQPVKRYPQLKTSKTNKKEEDAGGSFEAEEEEPKEMVKKNLTENYQMRTRQQVKSESSPETDSSSEEEVEEEVPRSSLRRRLKNQSESRRVQVKYHLRQNKPAVDRFQAAEPDKRRPSRAMRDVISVRKHRRRSSSSSSDSSSDDKRFDRKKGKSKSRNKSRMELIGGGGGGGGETGGAKEGGTALSADVAPVALDQSIRFANVGGLEKHVTCLKEMVVFPMLYPEVFAKFGVTPPKGVLFHGPPGTGKTLVARALANECSLGARKVSFFMRKGADCLSKWVGESERQLRLLFEEAKQARPSIIFFDELDGLAPVRSTKQDQIHASIVCTLLALMDGLDNRGDIVVIGATNRIDSIDPALRRPGRFDRELFFPLPGVEERREILKIHSTPWGDKGIVNQMAELSAGYCGSDLKALCTEAVIQALKRVYPQIYSSDQKLLLDPDKVKVESVDFKLAHRGIVPASQRAVVAHGRKLPQFLEPLLGEHVMSLVRYVNEVFPPATSRKLAHIRMVKSPRLLLVGQSRHTMLVATALLHKLEHCPVLSIGLETLFSDPTRSPEETITKAFRELPHNPGSILWLGDLFHWWNSLSDSVQAVFLTMNSMLDPGLPVLYLATTSSSEIPYRLQSIFSSYRGEIQVLGHSTIEQRRLFLRPLFRLRATRPPPPPRKNKAQLEPLEVAPPPPPPKLSEQQLNSIYNDEENTLRELRIFLRQICSKLARNKQFYMFSKPVDINEVPDYLQIIKEPMDLETMMTKIDLHKYTCAQDFLSDIDLLCKNALEYNPDRDPADKLIRHRACFLRDTAYALIKAEMDSDFEISCRSIREQRKQRSEDIKPEERFIKQFFPIDNPDPAEEGGTNNEQTLNSTEVDTKGEGNSQVEGATPKAGGEEEGVETRNSSEVKRRKRRNPWCKGSVPNKKLKPKTPNQQQKNEVSNSSAEKNKLKNNDEEKEHSETKCEPSGHSTPVKKSTDNDLNDSVLTINGIVESLCGDEKETADESSNEKNQGPKRLILDNVEMSKVLDEAVESTKDDHTLESLIDLYSGLRRVIDSYAKKWDRTNLPHDLRAELKKFAEYAEQMQAQEEEEDEEEEEGVVVEETTMASS